MSCSVENVFIDATGDAVVSHPQTSPGDKAPVLPSPLGDENTNSPGNSPTPLQIQQSDNRPQASTVVPKTRSRSQGIHILEGARTTTECCGNCVRLRQQARSNKWWPATRHHPHHITSHRYIPNRCPSQPTRSHPSILLSLRSSRSNRYSRHGVGGGNGNRRGGGFSGFGNFPDPFANFGMGSRGRSIFDVFDNDPFFNDPFFTRPFGSMFGGQGGGLFGGSQGFLGNSVFDNYQTTPRAPATGYLEDRPRSPPQYHQQRDPIIEELPDSDSDADAEPRSSSRPGQQPIIEHPDDDLRPEPQERQRPFQGSVIQAGPLAVLNNNGGVRSYTFQSSSVSYRGSNGAYYSSSAARRMGPNGVIEEEFQEKDSTSGRELKRHSRGLGVKGRSITRKRTSEGREQTLETLHNLQEEEVPNFERNWEDQARFLPQWNRFRPHSIGAPHGSGSRSRIALPGSSSSQGGRL